MKYLLNFATQEEYDAVKDNLPETCVVTIDDHSGAFYKIESKDAIILNATNLKTINGESLIGTGNIVITGGEGGGTTIDPTMLEGVMKHSKDFGRDFNNDF